LFLSADRQGNAARTIWTGKLKLPDGWLTGNIFLAVVPVGGSQENVDPSGLETTLFRSVNPHGKAAREKNCRVLTENLAVPLGNFI
jgi:hypothetical protein